MKLLYINDELASGDGSNSHAIGMLTAFREILGAENVESYPEPENGSEKAVNYGANRIKTKLKGVLAFVRFFRKKYISVKKSKTIVGKMKRERFTPTHVLARSTDFDVTAIYVAKEFKAKLIYEVNTPMFYERGVIKKEPMIGALEKWERRIIDTADCVYVVSNVCRDMLCDHYGISRNKFIVVPNGYMAELYTETDEERKKICDSVRKAEGLEDKFVVAFVGSLKVWHGIKTFCETAELMESDREVRFLVLGDGEMHDMITDYAKNHSNMIFKGKVDLEIMKQYLYASDLGIMPYAKQENFYYSPLKMYDMIGAGLPFIGTAVGQIEEFCKENGMENALIESVSAEILAAKIHGIKENELEMSIENKENNTWKCRVEQLIERISISIKEVIE